jgi:hypothetical protein
VIEAMLTVLTDGGLSRVDRVLAQRTLIGYLLGVRECGRSGAVVGRAAPEGDRQLQTGGRVVQRLAERLAQ